VNPPASPAEGVTISWGRGLAQLPRLPKETAKRRSEDAASCAGRSPVSTSDTEPLWISVDSGGLVRAVTKTVRFRVSKRLEDQTQMVKAEGEGFDPSKGLHP
jgi:hypothetical protein